MSNCERTRQILDAWTVGAGDLSGLDREHVRGCARCADELWRAEAVQRALEQYARAVEGEASQAMSAAPPPPAAARPSRLVPGVAGAAGLLAVLSLLFVLFRTPPRQPQIPVEYLAALERVSTRNDVLDYLDRSQVLILTLIGETQDCLDGKVQIGTARRLAENLIYRKKLLEPQLGDPAHENVKSLCDDLELLLVDVAGSDNCVSREKLEMWQQVLDSRSTLMRLNLLRAEASI